MCLYTFMKISVFKNSILVMALGGMAIALSSCANHQAASASGSTYGPDGKPISLSNGVPVSTRGNQFSPGSGGGGGGGGG